MDFEIQNIQDNVVNLSRRIGYFLLGQTANQNEYNMVRKLSGNHYPRFHVYLKQRGDRWLFSLHLDQKAPIYEGSHAHSGDYDGPVVENEADRIKSLLNS